MREEIYQWLKNLAIFYILLTALMHLVPDKKYGQYVRFFMGLLLVLMLCMPVVSIMGKGKALAEGFQVNYAAQDRIREQEELENLQQAYLQKGYALEVEGKIREELENSGIYAADVEVHIEGEDVRAAVYMNGTVTGEQERRIADGLSKACGLREGEFEIKAFEPGEAAVGGDSSSGTSAGGGGAAGIREKE